MVRKTNLHNDDDNDSMRIVPVFSQFIEEKSIQPYDIEEQGKRGDPICVSTLSSHCNGPFKCNSIQQGVDVTVCRRYAAPQPFTKLILIVHIRVN